MLPTTADALKALLKADPSLTPDDRSAILAAVRNHGREPEKKEPEPKTVCVLQRAEVARRFGRSLRFVDKLAVQGVLRRVKLPGRQRACGYREDEVERLIAGEALEG
jgi:hypothetical protein